MDQDILEKFTLTSLAQSAILFVLMMCAFVILRIVLRQTHRLYRYVTREPERSWYYNKIVKVIQSVKEVETTTYTESSPVSCTVRRYTFINRHSKDSVIHGRIHIMLKMYNSFNNGIYVAVDDVISRTTIDVESVLSKEEYELLCKICREYHRNTELLKLSTATDVV